ncbi:MAG: hypothetical protein WBP16_06580 [Ferruginibacter sp.]
MKAIIQGKKSTAAKRQHHHVSAMPVSGSSRGTNSGYYIGSTKSSVYKTVVTGNTWYASKKYPELDELLKKIVRTKQLSS